MTVNLLIIFQNLFCEVFYLSRTTAILTPNKLIRCTRSISIKDSSIYLSDHTKHLSLCLPFLHHSFWDTTGTASTVFWGGFFLWFGGNWLHRILGWIIFEIRRELPPHDSTNFWVGFFLRFGGNWLHRIFLWILFEIRRELAPQNIFVDSFWVLAGTASTEFFCGFFLRFGGFFLIN